MKLVNITPWQKEILEEIPSNDWVTEKALGTSRSVLKGLLLAGLIRKKIQPNPSSDPRLGFLYQRC